MLPSPHSSRQVRASATRRTGAPSAVSQRPAVTATITLYAALCGLLVAGCAQHRGTFEASNAECMDSLDNDGDGLTDCDDPDCRGTRHCIGQALQRTFPPTGGTQQATGGTALQPATGGQPTPPEQTDAAVDAGRPALDAQTLDSGAPPPEMDASTPADAAAPVACPLGICAEGTVCMDGVCEPGGRLGTEPLAILLRITRATVPYGRLQFGEQILFDLVGITSSWAIGGLGPDPYVAVLLNGYQVWQTTVQKDNIGALWDIPGVKLEITGDDQLVFEARDYDSLSADGQRVYDPMFSCSPTFPNEIPTTPVEIGCGDKDALLNFFIMGTVQLLE